MNIKNLMRWWQPRETLIASFGGSDLLRNADGGYELRGGTPGDRQVAREWISLFLHEACPNVAAAGAIAEPQAAPAKAA